MTPGPVVDPMTTPTTLSVMEMATKIVKKIEHDAAALQDSSYIAAFEVLPSRLIEEIARALSERDEELAKAHVCPACGETTIAQDSAKTAALDAQLRERELAVEKTDEEIYQLDMRAQQAEQELARLREALAQLISEQHDGWHDLSKAPAACGQYPCTLLIRRPVPKEPA